MQPEGTRWADVRRLFEEVIAVPAEDRPPRLAAHGDDPTLQREVLALADAHDRAGSFLDTPADPVSSIWIGRRVGAYRILETIGRGGMGQVFLAERADDLFEKRVAIKIVRLTADADQIVERFKRERQILATLDHPNITRMLDAGVTDDNVPFVVMEYVDGASIDSYCDAHNLDLRARLELLHGVCLAVHAAHAHGVIHRDLKAANIRVTTAGVPKLLDFGIAKVIEPGRHNPVLTRTADRVLTPSTAAPEQVAGGETTVATDVYALGVLLYQLATGRLPFGTPHSASDLAHAILHEVPQRPSHVARIPAALDWVILKALHKQPGHRYHSAEALAADVRRCIDGVDPERTAVDRTRMIVSRLRANRAAAAARLLVAVLLAAGGVTASRYLVGTDIPDVDEVLIVPFMEIDAHEPGSRLGWGMADALFTRLSHVEALRVRLVDDPVQSGVRVEGTVQHSADRVRVAARLVDGPGGDVLWSTSVEDRAENLFAIQDRLSLDILWRLSPRFDVSGVRARSSTRSAAAYEAYVEGRYHLSQVTPEAVRNALYHFERSASADPLFAAAHAGIATAYVWLRDLSPLSPVDQSVRGRDAARRALELQEQLGEAHAALGVLTLIDDWDWPRAERAFKRALELSPTDAMAATWYAVGLTAHGRVDEALEHLRRGRSRDPLNRPLQIQLVRVLYMARQFDEAIRECERIAAEDPSLSMAFCGLSRLHGGSVDQGIAELEAIARSTPPEHEPRRPRLRLRACRTNR